MVGLTYLFLPQMRSQKLGTIINVDSMAGFLPLPMGVYAATKGFVKSFTEALWEENRLYNIQTMLLCPGATETGIFDAAKIGADGKNSFSTKNMETAEDVVDSAMSGLTNKKMVTISGWQNKLGKFFLGLPIPMTILLKMFGNQLRKELNLEIK